jgi:hypothetical protein
MKQVYLILPIKTVSEANSRESWRAKNRRKRSQAFEVEIEWKQAMKGRAVSLPCVVTLTRIASRLLDDDNLRSAFKGVRDCVAALVGVDDGSDLIRFEYKQERRAKRTYDVKIEVESEAER